MLTRSDHERIMRELEVEFHAKMATHSQAIDILNRGTDQGADLAIAVEALNLLAEDRMAYDGGFHAIARKALEKMKVNHG